MQKPRPVNTLKNQIEQQSKPDVLASGWDVEIESSIQRIGQGRRGDDEEPPIPSSELILQAQSRLRIIEEDRDALSQQAVQLQIQLDRERKSRHASQEVLSHCSRSVSERRETGEEQARRDADTLAKLRAEEAKLRAELEAAERAPAASHAEDVLSSLRQRAEEAEAAAAQRQAVLRKAQEELLTRLAVTLKVLQLQKAQAAAQEARRDRVHAAQAEALRFVVAARAEEMQRAEARRALARRAEALLDGAAMRAREVGGAQAAAEALARSLRGDAETLRRAEEGLSLDFAAAERERLLHDYVLRELAAETAASASGAGGAGPAGSLADAMQGLWDQVAAGGPGSSSPEHPWA
jgi:hypothetical protein